MSDQNESIDVSEKTLERYERQKAEMDAADPNLPDMNNDQFMKCLLDTLEAVDSGLYSTMPASEEMRETLARHREKLNDKDAHVWIDPEQEDE